MSSQDERDFEPPSSTPSKNKAMISPRSSRSIAASTAATDDHETFGRPKSWQQFDKRGGADDQTLLSPFVGGQHHARNYHQSLLRSVEKPPHKSQSIHRAPSSEQPIDYPDPDAMDEDIGADYLSLDMPMGSFADDSPPRSRRSPSKREEKTSEGPPDRSLKASPARSTVYHPFGGPAAYHHPPPYYQKSPRSSSYPPVYYSGQPPQCPPSASKTSAAADSHPGNPDRRSPPRSSGAPPPPQHYPYPPPGPPPPGHGYPPYYPYPMHHPGGHPRWASPKPYDDMFGYGSPRAKQSNVKEAFRASPPRRSPMPPPPVDGSDAATTPEKMKPMRSPFRSPPFGQTNGKSPMMFRSPALGAYGSFGMIDTPGGTLAAEFSPMGPMLHNPFTAEFGECEPPKLPLSRSHSDGNMDEDSEPHDAAASPFTGFINDFNYVPPPPNSERAAAEGLQGVPRSPLRSEKRAAQTASVTAPRSERQALQPVPITQSSEKQPSVSKKDSSSILASPHGLSSGAKPRKLWTGPDSSRQMRFELGNASSQRKSLDNINSMMKSQSGLPMATPSSRTTAQAPPPSTYRTLNTPIKLEPSPVQGKSTAASTASGNKRVYPPSAANNSSRDPKVARSGGKENKKGGKNGTKRGPCNCKKSKCLKLYCECFSAELFCDGCNCGDCKNTAEFKDIRDKAMKDTRAKNPNAFKPRIGVKGPVGMVAVPGASPQTGHNMGCRCKRSECLKKYCECFQAGVMCGTKCKCKDCMNFAGSQKLIDKRRKIKDQRGADLAMKAADQTWKGQQSARKLPVARPAVHGMRPMPSPVATPGGRMPMANPNMMNPSPSGHPPAPPYHMRPPYMGHHYGHMGYSPLGMHPHMSPPGYGMYPPHPPIPTPVATKKQSPSAAQQSAKPRAKTNCSTKATPSRKATSPAKSARTPTGKSVIKSSPEPALLDSAGKAKPQNGSSLRETHHVEPKPTKTEQSLPDDKQESLERVVSSGKIGSSDNQTPLMEPSPRTESASKSQSDSCVQPTPSEKPAASKVTPMPPTPANKSKARDAPEPTSAFFGKNVQEQPKSTCVAVFSYLKNSDLETAGLVCREWNRLSKDGTLWEFLS